MASYQWRGEFRDPLSGAAHQGLERLGDVAVEPPPSSGRQVVVERVLDECVHERVAIGATGGLRYDGGLLSQIEEVEEIVLAGLGHLGEEADVEIPADRRGGGEHTRRVGREAFDPPTHNFTHAHGEAMGAQICDR